MKKKILVFLLLYIVKVEAQTSTFATIDNLFEKGRYQLALSELKKVQEPSFLSNYKTALIYEAIDDYKKTAIYLEKALVFKEDAKASLKLAKAYQRLKKTSKSIQIYEDILAKDSLNLLLKYQLGKLYLISRKSEESIKTFQDLIEKDAENANYYYQLGLSYALKNDRNRMMNSFIQTFKNDTTHLKAIAHLASSYNKLKDLDSTRIFVDRGLVLNPNHINLNKIKINQFYREKKFNEAIPFLLNLDTIVKKDTYPTSMLGRTYYNLDSLEKAKKYFRKLSRMDRENYKAYTYQGHIAYKEKDFKNAQMYYRMATFVAKERRDEEYYGLATVYYEMKKPKEAIFNFDKAYKENYGNYKALFQLAKMSEDYYKDKKIAYKHYVKYLDKFQNRDEDMTNFCKRRVAEIKKEFFMKGETLK
ncbi:MAG: tetratricopeptide repeat protein [Polaribacter sp.]